MRSCTSSAFGLLWIAFALFACARPPQKFKLDFPHKSNELILTVRAGENIEALGNAEWTSLANVEVLNDRSMVLRFPEGTDLEKAAEQLIGDRRIQAVEANAIYRLDDTIPNDPDFAKLYAMRNVGSLNGVLGADIGMVKAWDKATGSASVLIAIIDSGVDYNHQDLAENIWTNPGESGLDASGRDKRNNAVDDDENGFVDDWHGWDFYNNDNNPMDDNSHGSHVAGTIGGRGNNNKGVVGVNWAVSMVPVKVFSAAGESSADILIRGIDYSTTLGIVASNNSWGGGSASAAMLAAIERANSKGILFIAAAGNDSTNNDLTPHYPSTYDLPNIISVASTDRKDMLSGFSNYGVNTVQVAAPGSDIYSTIPNNGYDLKSGTSMATPHVTGLVALLKSRFPALDAQGLKAKILASTQIVSQLQSSVKFGRIDAASALEDDSIAPSSVQDIIITETGIKDLRLSWKEAGDDGSVGLASRYLVRLAAEPITTEEQWAQAAPIAVTELLQKDGRASARIINLQYNQQSFLSIRGLDNVGNIGELSASTPFSLSPVRVLFNEDNDSVAAWKKLDTPWGIALMDGLSYLSDSPGGSYQNNLETIAETNDFSFNDTDLILDLRTRYQLEANYDFGYIELSRDQGQTWVELGKLTGTSDWTTFSFGLKDLLQGARVFRIRLKLKTDYSISYDGWDIDSFQIVGRQL